MTPNSFSTIEEFISGCILLIDKPYDWSSFDVLNRIKGFVRHHIDIPLNGQGDSQRFKIGHAGTLDPLATGLLVVCTGKYTKRITELQSGIKEYTGCIVFGKTTPSFDLETAPEGDFETAHITQELLEQAAQTFLGEQLQTPPIYSAKQVDGKRAYKAARAGKEMVIASVNVHVHHFAIERYQSPKAYFTIRCSKGTYIRTIASEMGTKLQSGAFLTDLRRTASDPFSVQDAFTVDQLLDKLLQLTTTKSAEIHKP